MKIWMLRAALAISSFVVSACGDSESNRNLEVGLAIVGSYDDNWDAEHEITETTWTTAGAAVFNITAYDNEEHWVIAQNDPDNEWNAGQFSRFDWAPFDSKLYFCQTVFDAEDEDTALNTPPADVSDLEGGCSGFAWTELFEK